jgi:tetratricopeptide (TPR) repeat protein
MSSFFDTTGDPLAALSIDTSAQKAQIAQYAIQAAAKYLQNGNNDGAIKEFKKAIAFDVTNETAQTYLGKIYMSQNKNVEAIKVFKTYAQQQPLSVNAQVNLGNAYLQNKQYVESEAAFKKAARLDPINPVADYTLGQQYLTQGRYSEAKSQFNKVVKVAPKDGNVYYALGMLNNKTEKPELAIANLTKALALKPNFPAANYELGVAYDAAGDSRKAADQLSILKTKDTSLASQLSKVLNKPKIVSMDGSKSGFVDLLGPGTPLWALDPSLMTANASKEFSVDITFSNEMDIGSIMNPSNWNISRANSTEGGYYNSTIPTTSREVTVPPIPLSVTYNAIDQIATVKFRITQNANADARIDPSHLVFKFSGKDASGRAMDQAANEVDGYALGVF